MKNILNIAVIGASKMAELHIKGVVNNPNAALYAVCDIDAELVKNVAAKYDCKKYTEDYRTLVNDPELDGVVIVTPDQVHCEMTEAFLRAGKDVLCEKPMALSLEECEKMMKAEKESGRMLMIGQVCRCTPAFKMAKTLVDDGMIGELFYVESEYAHNYEKSQGKDKWRMTPERDGFIGGGCHAVDLLRWIAGDPSEVTAYSNHKCLTDWPTNDCTVAIFKFPDNVIGKVFASIGCCRSYTMRTVLYGTKGTIICDNTSPEITVFTSEGYLPNGKGTYNYPKTYPVVINNHNVVEEVRDFVDAIINGKPSPVSSVEGASTVAVCRAAVESAANNQPVKIKYPEK